MRNDAAALKSEPTLTGRTKNVSVLLRSEDSRVELASAFKDIAGVDSYLLLRPASMAGSFGRGDVLPDVLLVEVDPSKSDDINYLRALKATAALAHTPVVAITDSTKHLAAIGAIRAGADDVVLTPINRNDLLEVLGRVTGTVPQTGSLGRLIAFAHVSGGAGATTLAVNAAASIAASGNVDGVCLLDLDIQYGNAASLLDIQKVSPVDVLIDEPARLDREMLESMVIPHDCGVNVLTAPKLPFALGSYRSDMVANLLQLAKRRYSVVVADLPVALAPWSDVVLREASLVFIVCTPNVSAVHRLVQFLRLMEREHLADLPYRIVLNRHHARSEGGDISPQRFAKAVGRPVDYTIPNDYRLVSLSHNQGKPAIGLGPSSRFTQELTAMLSAELGGSVLKPTGRPWWQIGGN